MWALSVSERPSEVTSGFGQVRREFIHVPP